MIYFETIYARRLIIIYYKTLPKYDNSINKQHNYSKNQGHFFSFGNTHNVAFLKI